MRERPRTLGYWLRVIARRWPIVLGATVIGAALGLAYSSTQPTLYEARSTLVLSSTTGFNPEGSRDLPAIATTVAGLARTDAVLTDAGTAFAASGGAESAARASRATIEWLRTHVAARVPPETSLVEISAHDETQADAVALASASAKALIGRLDALTAEPTNSLRIEQFGPPSARGQISPKPVQNAVLGANAGLLLGILFALLAGDRGLRARNPEDMADALGVGEVLALDVAATPHVRSLGDLFGDRMVLEEPPSGSDIERLVTRVAGAADRGASVIAVLGPVAADKLRSVSLGLGTRLAAAGEPTLVIDAALGHDKNGSIVPPGLGEALGGRRVDDLIGRLSLGPAVQGGTNGASLFLLPAGTLVGADHHALTSPAFRQLLREMRGRYRHVIVSGPSAAEQADSIAVAEQTDANVIVLPERLSLDHAREAMRSEEATVRPLVAVGVVRGS